MTLSNDGTSEDPSRGHYDAQVARKPNAFAMSRGELTQPLRTARVEDYPRLSYNVWRLVLKALRGAFPEDKG